MTLEEMVIQFGGDPNTIPSDQRKMQVVVDDGDKTYSILELQFVYTENEVIIKLDQEI